MSDLRELIIRIVGAVVAICLGLLVVVLVADALLPRLTRTTSLFITTPGGLLLVALAWRYMGRKKNG